MQQVIPRMVSWYLMVEKFSTTSTQSPVTPVMWFSSSIVRPKMCLIWPEAIVMAAADVKPAITGIEMKSITKPDGHN